MSLVEMEFGPAIKAIMKKEPIEIEAFIRKLVLMLARQSATIKAVRWSDESRALAIAQEEALEIFMRELVEVAQ